MDKDEAWNIKECGMNIVNDLKYKCWELHKKLGKPYNSSMEQLDDMIKMGELAQTAKDLWVANNKAYDMVRDHCDEK